MPTAVQRATCKLDSLGERTLADLVEKRRSFTARSIDRLIKVARTIADLLGQDDIDAGCSSKPPPTATSTPPPTSCPRWCNELQPPPGMIVEVQLQTETCTKLQAGRGRNVVKRYETLTVATLNEQGS
jgi:magnesium chelatase subunit ChlI-like protein